MADYRIWPATDGPAFAFEDDPVNLGTEFYVTETCWLTAIHCWRGATDMDGTVLGRVWIASGGSAGTALAGTDVTFALSGTGWQTAVLDDPVELTANVRYRASIHAPSGYTGSGNYWTSGAGSSGHTNGPLVAPSSGPGPTQSSFQGSFTYSAVRAYPASTFQGGNYWVDVTVADEEPGSAEGTGTAELTLSASSGGSKSTVSGATASIGLSAGGTGQKQSAGAVAAPVTLTAGGTGIHAGTSSATAPVTLDTIQAGQHAGVQTGTAPLGLAGAGPGTKQSSNSASAPLVLAASTVGVHRGVDARTATLVLATSITGTHRGIGVGTALLTLAASGVSPLVGWPAVTVAPTARRWATGGPPTGHRWATGGPPSETAG